MVVAADPRLAGAAERSLVATFEALAAAGFSTALIPILSAERDSRRRFPGRLRRLLASGLVRLVDPDLRCSCRLLLGYHLLPFLGSLSAPLRVEAEQRILRCDQPPLDVHDATLLHFPALLGGVDEAFGGEVALAPVDAGVAANLSAQLPRQRIAPPLPPVVAGARYRAGDTAHPKRIVLVGDGWQHDQAAAAKARADMASLGFEAILETAEGQQADAVCVRPPARLPGVLQPDLAEALVSRLPVLGPDSYRPALGACLVACGPDPVEGLRDTPSIDWQAAAAAACSFGVIFEPATFIERMRSLIGGPISTPRRLFVRRDLRPQQAAVFMSSNGVGMGHLVRGMAVARRLDGQIRPVFFTLSGGAHTAARQGWHVESFQHVHSFSGDVSEWREALAARMNDLVSFHRPRVFVFDGNVPYAALFDLREAHPDVWFVWVRRGMWRRTHDTVARLRHPFDVVVAPGELAADYDGGATAHVEDALPTAPITFFDADELSTRAEARLELQIEEGTTAVLLQLGAGNNFDMTAARSTLIDSLAGRPGVKVFEARWPMSFRDEPDPRIVRLERFPLAHLLRGFDLVVSACGYNSFHEILQARVPAVFVANENPEMDAQERRALWATRRGFAASGSALRPFGILHEVERLLETAERAALQARLAHLDFTNGAEDVAALVAELNAGRRTLKMDFGVSRLAAW